jgi:putative transposase
MQYKVYKVEIKPTKAQKEKLAKTFGVCRFVYNLFLATNFDRYKNEDIPKEEKFMSGYTFSKWLNNVYVKDNEDKLWIKEVSSKAVKQSIMNAEQAFKNWWKHKKGKPRFKKKSKQNTKAYFPKDNKKDCLIERHRIKVPTLGWVKLKEYGYAPDKGQTTSIVISQKADRFYASVMIMQESEYTKPEYKHQSEGVGIDLGVKDFAITSEGEKYKNVNKTVKVKKIKKRLRRTQRALSRKLEAFKKNKKNMKEGRLLQYGNNIRKNIIELRKLHAKLKNISSEYIQHVVNDLAKIKPEYITIEDLNVSGMVKNRHLAKSVSEQCFYLFKQKLMQKCSKAGIPVRVANRFFASSKLCSSCGGKHKELKLKDRTWICPNCGTKHDRDVNAAKNLKVCEDYTIAS